eukprot:TRINITY_DN3429_c0_g4_i3.p1 TRINITY_DN3429_c0_g4~~TRINITY_DN3429_c0_g4_i3.p1  ORF type:complete len:1705 (+),score=283.87 TRINITY_DN3429_c0_g4_i3:276-5390(+)
MMSQAEEKTVIKRIERDDPELTSLRWKIYEDESIVVRICKKMKKNTHLKQLFLLGNITNASCAAISQLLSESKTLEYLNLSQTKIGAKGIEKIAKGIKTNVTLRWLMLTQTKHPQLNDVGINALAAALRDNNTLTRLELTSFNITNVGAKALAGLLLTNKGLQVLKLSSNPFTNDGMKDLARSLKFNTTLKQLYLDRMVRGDANVSDKGALFMAHICGEFNKTLDHLSFSQCTLDIKSVESLANMTTTSGCGLRNLQLASCNLSDAQLDVIGAVLRQNCALTSLDLSSNAINIDGLRRLHLQSNCKLQQLYLATNKLDDLCCGELAEILRFNNGLEKLFLTENPAISARGLLALGNSIEYNFTLRSVMLNENDKGRGLKDANVFLERNQKKYKTMEEFTGAGKSEKKLMPFPTFYRRGIDLGGFGAHADPKQTTKELRKGKSSAKAALAKSAGAGGLPPSEVIIERLMLYNNRMTVVPEEIILYSNTLSTLDLSGNDITVIPNSIMASLPRLEHLNLKHNKIQSIAPDIANLQGLRTLALDHNLILSLPRRMLTLPRLRTLSLAENPIERTNPILVMLYGQINMPNVNLSKLNLFAIPEEFFLIHNLAQIETLDLSDNDLRSLPPDIIGLSSLISLNLTRNRIETLPWQLGTLTNLRTLDLTGNPMSLVPDVILTQGVQSILSFLLAQKDGKTKVYRMKLMFVGEENVGKTSLFRTIAGEGLAEDKDGQLYAPADARMKKAAATATARGPLMDHQNDTVSTDGIDIHYLRFPKGTKENQRELVLGCWDFAGQEIYYATHAFFLSKRSIFLAVFNLAEDLDHSRKRLDYWLASIHSKTKKCAVLVIGTHLDHKRCTKEHVDHVFGSLQKAYETQYPHIKGYFALSTRTKKGFKEFFDVLMDITLSQQHMGEEVPTSYMGLEEQLTISRKILSPPVIHMDTFKELASKCGLTERTSATALQFMHDLGIIINFAGNNYRSNVALENLIILDPTWISNVFRSIVTTKLNFVVGGIIDNTNLSHIWKAPLYPPELHNSLLAILETCEISYPLKKGLKEGRSLIATLLPDLIPSVTDLENEGWIRHYSLDKSDIQRDSTLIRVYRLDFLPHGLFSRFMVRTLSVTQPRLYWKNGFLVQHKSQHGVSIGLFVANPDTNTIVLKTRGAAPGNLMTSVATSLFNLINAWFEVESTAYTLCACDHCGAAGRADADRTWIPLKDCEKAVYKNVSTAHCPLSPTGNVVLDFVTPDLTLYDLRDNMIEHASIEKGKILGEGGNALVYLGTWKGKQVALKELKLNVKAGMSEEKAERIALDVFNDFRAEAWIMRLLKHPNIVEMIGVCKHPTSLVTEFMPFGSLYDFILREDIKKYFSWRMRMKVVTDIALGVAFMHGLTPPIIHRDLKTLNVLMASDDPSAQVVAKVADFGTCVAATTFVGRVVDNPLWLAPEIMAGFEYSEKADVYSFGMIMYEVVERKLPFDEFDVRFVSKLEKQIEDGLRPTVHRLITPEPYIALMRECWDGDPSARPDMTDVVKRLREMTPQLQDLPFEWLNPEAPADEGKIVFTEKEEPKSLGNSWAAGKIGVQTSGAVEEQLRPLSTSSKEPIGLGESKKKGASSGFWNRKSSNSPQSTHSNSRTASTENTDSIFEKNFSNSPSSRTNSNTSNSRTNSRNKRTDSVCPEESPRTDKKEKKDAKKEKKEAKATKKTTDKKKK